MNQLVIICTRRLSWKIVCQLWKKSLLNISLTISLIARCKIKRDGFGTSRKGRSAVRKIPVTKKDRDSEGGKSELKRHRDSEGGKSEQKKRKCFNLPNHISKDCPTKTQGPKCFKCSEHGHLVSKCVEQPKTAGAIDIMQSTRKKCIKEVSINDQKIEALIDTRNNICVMCTDQYIRSRFPEVREKDDSILRYRFRR